MGTADNAPPVAAAPPARNSLYILVARLVELGASVGVAAIVARHLGVHGYGRYALIVSFVMLFGQFISFGLEHIIIREVARAPGRLRELLGSGMTLEFALGLAVVPTVFALSFLLGVEPGDRAGVLFFAGAFFLRAFYEVIFRSTFIACGAARFETALTLLYQTVRLGVVAAVAYAGGGVAALLAAVLVAEAVNAVAAYAVLRLKFVPAGPRWNRRGLVFLVSQAWPIALMGILNNIFFQQDTLLLKVLLGDYRAVGLFAAAYRLVTFFIFVTIPTLWPLLPEFAKLAGGAGEREALAAGARRAGRAVLLYVLPPTVLVAAFAPELVRLVFGGAYAPAAAALTVVAVSMTARPVGYMSDATLIAAGRQRYLALVAAAAVLVNLALDLILIPRLGFMGAAWGTAVADVVGLILSLVIASAVLRRFVFDAGALAPVALAAAGGVALYLARRFTAVPAPVLFVAAAAAFGAGAYCLLGRETRAALGRALGLSGGSGDAGG